MSTIQDKPSGGTKKTIQINHDFFKMSKKGGAQTKVTRSASKRATKPKALKKNTIKQELTKRIQERKQQEVDEIHQRRASLAAAATGGGYGAGPPQSELVKSLSYLNEFVKNKKKVKKGGATSHRNRTIKQPRDPQVNVELPEELNMTIRPMEMHRLAQPITQHPSTQQPSNSNQSTQQLQQPAAYTYDTNPPPYSNLKNSVGGKPSYKVWNHTRKQRPTLSSVPITSIPTASFATVSAGASTGATERERNLARAKQQHASGTASGTASGNASVKKPPPSVFKKQYTPKIIKQTITHKYTVGRRKGGRKISVLVKNLKTRKRVNEAKKQLRKTSIPEIKSYLKEHGFLKTGSVAPANVLREMYESAMMAGDIRNINGGVAIHNYISDADKEM